MKQTGCLSNYRKCLLPLAVLLPLLAVLVLATPVIAAPTITVLPSSGAAGTLVTINGANFDSFTGDSVTITFNGEEIAGSPLVIPDTGDFEVVQDD